MAESRFSPRVSVSAVWTDNFLLVSPPEPKDEELIGQVRPGFEFVRDSPRLRAFVDYELQALYSAQYESDAEVYHKGNLGVVLRAVPDWLSVDLAGVYQQSVVDPTQPHNVDNLFRVANTADTFSARVTPALHHAFRAIRLDAEYSYGVVEYKGIDGTDPLDPSLAESTYQDASLSLGSSDAEAALTWSARYRAHRVDYDEFQTFEHERADAELGLRVARALWLIGRGGLESDPLESIRDGGLDDTFWQAGFAWRRSEQDEFRLLAGERFFGTSYEAVWRRVGRSVNWDVSYTEEPTTQAQELVLRETPDAEDVLTPDRPFDRPGSDVYLLKRLAGRLGLSGRITEIALEVHSERREYIIASGIEDRIRGASVIVTRALGPRVRAELESGIDENELREGSEFDERYYSLKLSRRLGTRTSADLTIRRSERSGAIQAGYEVNWVVLGVQASF
ncbi:MAG: TIGR03016 family PEP-CTERM system-associated outer membrane protein [Gammaproteobacteria bacterium]